MPAIKQKSIAEIRLVATAICGANREKLRDLERVMARDRRVKDVCDVPNADIINDAITRAWILRCGGKK